MRRSLTSEQMRLLAERVRALAGDDVLRLCDILRCRREAEAEARRRMVSGRHG